jgi:hypothetical protein
MSARDGRPRISEQRPTSLPEYLEYVELRQRKAGHSLWYRGCGLATHELRPSLYRHRKATTPEQLATLERELMTRFRQRSIPYHSRSLSEDWDALFFMQHYKIPTRLLDWTENPFIALHFALMDAPSTRTKSGNLTYESDAAVWILDPVVWNQHALRHQSFKGAILTPDDEALKGYRPAPAFEGMRNHPVALYGAHNSGRIVAQQGAFTIFGRETTPMEDLAANDAYPEGSLVKVTLTKSRIKRMRASLLNHGISEAVVFPDLEGLAREIKRTFGFED